MTALFNLVARGIRMLVLWVAAFFTFRAAAQEPPGNDAFGNPITLGPDASWGPVTGETTVIGNQVTFTADLQPTSRLFRLHSR